MQTHKIDLHSRRNKSQHIRSESSEKGKNLQSISKDVGDGCVIFGKNMDTQERGNMARKRVKMPQRHRKTFIIKAKSQAYKDRQLFKFTIRLKGDAISWSSLQMKQHVD